MLVDPRDPQTEETEAAIETIRRQSAMRRQVFDESVLEVVRETAEGLDRGRMRTVDVGERRITLYAV